MKITPAILALPRRNRRALYLLAHRDDHSVTWASYRRWDGGPPRIYAGIDALKAKEGRKKVEIGDKVLAHGWSPTGLTAIRQMFRRQKTA
jgi:hypothetical protein